jgi:hypothetical protein
MVRLHVADDRTFEPEQMTPGFGFKPSPEKAMPTLANGAIPVKTSGFHAQTRIFVRSIWREVGMRDQ